MLILFVAYFVIGITIGSFLNVCIYRLPVGMSIVSPPSRCGTCGHRLGALDMIPVLSYFLLGGKCRYCHTPYSPRYALVELLTGLLFALAGRYYLPGVSMLLVFIFISCLVVITFIDFDHQIIMNRFVLILLVTGALYNYFYTKAYLQALGGMAFAGGLMLIIYFLSRGGMGEGDVKLSFALGLWLGFPNAAVLLLLSFVMGGIVGIILLAAKLKGRKDPIPFGPYLCISAYLTLLFGPYMIYYYWQFFALK
jgi:leader peptidase (prepilin peptidase)/N-methyltransferase